MSFVLPDPVVVVPESAVKAQQPAHGEPEVLNPQGVQRDLTALGTFVKTLSNVAAVRATVPGTQTLATGTNGVVTLAAQTWSTVPGMVSGNQIVLPRPGIWLGSGWVRWNPGTAGAEALLALRFDGVETCQDNGAFQATWGPALSVTDHFIAEAAGSTIEMFAFNGDPGTRTITAGAVSVSYVGPLV